MAAPLDVPIDLRRVAAATAVAIGTVALAAVAYLLLDVFLLLFLGIVVAGCGRRILRVRERCEGGQQRECDRGGKRRLHERDSL